MTFSNNLVGFFWRVDAVCGAKRNGNLAHHLLSHPRITLQNRTKFKLYNVHISKPKISHHISAVGDCTMRQRRRFGQNIFQL
jgi:hypothetical protein